MREEKQHIAARFQQRENEIINREIQLQKSVESLRKREAELIRIEQAVKSNPALFSPVQTPSYSSTPARLDFGVSQLSTPITTKTTPVLAPTPTSSTRVPTPTQQSKPKVETVFKQPKAPSFIEDYKGRMDSMSRSELIDNSLASFTSTIDTKNESVRKQIADNDKEIEKLKGNSLL